MIYASHHTLMKVGTGLICCMPMPNCGGGQTRLYKIYNYSSVMRKSQGAQKDGLPLLFPSICCLKWLLHTVMVELLMVIDQDTERVLIKKVSLKLLGMLWEKKQKG